MAKKTKVNKYTITTKGSYVKIFINDILHVAIKYDETVAVQTWVKGAGWFCIEIYGVNKNVTMEYDSYDKWIAIINLLNTVIK